MVSLAAETKADLLAFAEYEADPSELLKRLGNADLSYYEVPIVAYDRVRLFTTFNPEYLVPQNEGDRFSIRQFVAPGKLKLLICVTHLQSRLHRSLADQVPPATALKAEIEQSERDVEHSNTVVFGDFNFNPFDDAMISAQALNAVPDLSIASRGHRIVDNKQHSFFYNPMWNLLGDFNGPAGTYYYSASGYRSDFWHMMDQVILRPDIANRFLKEKFSILRAAQDLSLVSGKGRPSMSDHLPIRFAIDVS